MTIKTREKVKDFLLPSKKYIGPKRRFKMVTVYSKNNCMQCKMVKKWLSEHEIAFNEINIDEQPEFVEKVIEMGFRAAPVITKDDFAFSGFRPSELAKLA